MGKRRGRRQDTLNNMYAELDRSTTYKNQQEALRNLGMEAKKRKQKPKRKTKHRLPWN